MTSRIVLENIGRYILRKPNFRQKITILNSLIVPKNLKEGTLWDCEISIMLQNILKIEGGTIKIFEKTKKEFLASLRVPKNLKGETLWAFPNFSVL